MGCRTGVKTSRYEHFSRVPNLENALAFQTVLGVPVKDLFAGTFQKVEIPILKRARLLARTLSKGPICERTRRKLEALERIARVAGVRTINDQHISERDEGPGSGSLPQGPGICSSGRPEDAC